MGIFGVIIMILIILVCALLGAACLKLAKQTVNFSSVAIFTVTGGIIGFVTMMLWGFLFANSEGTLKSGESVIGMFFVSGLLAVMSGLYTASFYRKRKSKL